MIEFLNMGGYAFYVWSSFAVFALAILSDFVSLRVKQKTVRRNIASMLKRKNNRS